MSFGESHYPKRREFERYVRTLRQDLPLMGETRRPEVRDYANDKTETAWEFWKRGWDAGAASVS